MDGPTMLCSCSHSPLGNGLRLLCMFEPWALLCRVLLAPSQRLTRLPSLLTFTMVRALVPRLARLLVTIISKTKAFYCRLASIQKSDTHGRKYFRSAGPSAASLIAGSPFAACGLPLVLPVGRVFPLPVAFCCTAPHPFPLPCFIFRAI